jgi:hypothetical protein
MEKEISEFKPVLLRQPLAGFHCYRFHHHYVGGKEDEDEWLLKSSPRLRPAQEDEKSSNARSSNSQRETDRATSDRTTDSQPPCEESTEHRPMRQSRITSGDARLAFLLQEEEVRATRKKMPPSRKRKVSHGPPPSEMPKNDVSNPKKKQKLLPLQLWRQAANI